MSAPSGHLFYSTNQSAYRKSMKESRLVGKILENGELVEYTEMIDLPFLQEHPDAITYYQKQYPDYVYRGFGFFLRWS